MKKLALVIPILALAISGAASALSSNSSDDTVLAPLAQSSSLADPSRWEVTVFSGSAPLRNSVSAEPGFVDGALHEARFAGPLDLSWDPNGDLLVADRLNHAIRRVKPDGSVTTVAGTGLAGNLDGPRGSATFRAPVALAIGTGGNIFVADAEAFANRVDRKTHRAMRFQEYGRKRVLPMENRSTARVQDLRPSLTSRVESPLWLMGACLSLTGAIIAFAKSM
jgi:hypothetical protein